MSDDSPLGSAFVKGVGAVVAALVIFGGEQYIQHHWPDSGKNQPPAAIIPIDGRVIDSLGTKVITNALVDLNVNGEHQNQNTDSEGRYAFSVQGVDPNTAASMTVKAQGYEDASVNLLLGALEQNKELKLIEQAPKGGGGGSLVGKGLGPVVTAKPLTQFYVKRVDPKMLIAHK